MGHGAVHSLGTLSPSMLRLNVCCQVSSESHCASTAPSAAFLHASAAAPVSTNALRSVAHRQLAPTHWHMLSFLTDPSAPHVISAVPVLRRYLAWEGIEPWL